MFAQKSTLQIPVSPASERFHGERPHLHSEAMPTGDTEQPQQRRLVDCFFVAGCASVHDLDASRDPRTASTLRSAKSVYDVILPCTVLGAYPPLESTAMQPQVAMVSSSSSAQSAQSTQSTEKRARTVTVRLWCGV